MKEIKKVPDQGKIAEAGAGEIFLQELSKKPCGNAGFFSRFWNAIQIPVLAIFSGLFLGAVILSSFYEVFTAFGNGIGEDLRLQPRLTGNAYCALFAELSESVQNY